MSIDIIQYLTISVMMVSITTVYVMLGVPRWERIIKSAVRYHRNRLLMLMNEAGVGGETKEIAKLMLVIIDRQFSREMSAAGGYGSMPFRFLGGGKSALASMDEVFSKLFRDRLFGHESVYDERIDRLYHTLWSTISRWRMLHSILAVPVLAYMDFRVLLSAFGADHTGHSMLYRDIALGRFE